MLTHYNACTRIIANKCFVFSGIYVNIRINTTTELQIFLIHGLLVVDAGKQYKSFIKKKSFSFLKIYTFGACVLFSLFSAQLM